MVFGVKILVKIFAYLREECGFEETEMEVKGRTLDEVSREIIRQYPCLLDYDDNLLIALNRNFVPMDTVVKDGDEVALFPPVSGG